MTPTFDGTIPRKCAFALGPIGRPASPLTAVICGQKYGGTTMAAAVVDALGIPVVRDGACKVRFESESMNNAEGHDVEDAIADNDAKHPLWGWKDPAIYRFHPDWLSRALRNPHYIVVFRDAAAVGSRAINWNPLDETYSISELFDWGLIQMKELCRWAMLLKNTPRLLVSYDRAIANRSEFCQSVAEFLHLTPTDAEFDRAVARISPTGGYLTSAQPEED